MADAYSAHGNKLRSSAARPSVKRDCVATRETTIRARFAAHGYDAPHDLWTLIGRLAELNIVIERTDHLDDAALYEFLLGFLDEPLHLPNDPETIVHIDLVGSGSDEDNALVFRYYASDEEREHWMREFPHETLPPREHPPYDRDRLLPTAGDLRQRALHRRKPATDA